MTMISNKYNTNLNKFFNANEWCGVYLAWILFIKTNNSQTWCVETPQQNGRVERKNHHILGVACSLLFQSNFPKHLWYYVIAHVVHSKNRISTPLLSNKSPYQCSHNVHFDLNNLKVFGCFCYGSTLLSNRSKFDCRARESIFLGYKPEIKGFILYDINNRETFVSRNVKFEELVFHYSPSNNESQARPKWECIQLSNWEFIKSCSFINF